MMNPILTDWVTIATAGPTVDGREIKEQWLIDAAETYDREEYSAFLNVEHWAGNLGAVWEVRLGRDKKKRRTLEARIRPNKYYLQQNAEDYRLCFSVELTHNFAGTGKTYLTGLATTDYPASVGTTEARFARQENDPDVFRTGPQEITMGKPEESQDSGIIAAVTTALKNYFTNSKQPKEESDNMTQEELKAAFSEAVKPLTEKLESLTQEVTKLSENAKTSNNVSGVREAVEKLNGTVTELSEKFKALEVPNGKNIPAGSGSQNDEPLI